MKRPHLFISLLLASLLTGGCAVDTNPDSSYYRGSQSQKAARVYYGQVVSVTPLHSKNRTQDPWTNAAGVVLDGLNKGRSNADTSQVIGAVLGGLAGQALGQAPAREVEVLVLMEGSNEVLKVVQNNDVAFKTGQRVRVVTGGGINRVLPAQ